MRRRPRRSTLFPYTTLFRSQLSQPLVQEEVAGQPGNRRRAAQAEGEELVAHARVVRHQLHRAVERADRLLLVADRKSTRLNSSHTVISYAVFCLKKKKSKRM